MDWLSSLLWKIKQQIIKHQSHTVEMQTATQHLKIIVHGKKCT